MNARTRRAFTLVELLVVVGIVAALAALLTPVVIAALGRARQTTCGANLRQVSLAFQFYLNDSAQTYPYANDPVSVDPYVWLWMGRGWRSVLSEYLDAQDEVFCCPSDETALEKWESTSYAYSMSFYHSPRQINAMTEKADTYSNPQRSVPCKISRVSHPDRKVLVAEWLSNHSSIDDDRGWWCWEGARMALFVDGHTQSLKATEVMPANDGFPDFNLTRDGIAGNDLK